MARCKSKKVNKSVKNAFTLRKSKPKLRENDAESKLHRKRAFKKKALLKFAENSELTEASRKSSSVLKLVAHLEEKRVVKQSTDVDKLLQKLGVTNFDSSKAVDSDEIDSDSIENDHEAIKVESGIVFYKIWSTNWGYNFQNFKRKINLFRDFANFTKLIKMFRKKTKTRK